MPWSAPVCNSNEIKHNKQETANCILALICNGSAPSTDVDHKIRAEQYIAMHNNDETFFFDPKNLQGACHACHSRKTQLENKGLWHCNVIEGDMGSNL